MLSSPIRRIVPAVALAGLAVCFVPSLARAASPSVLQSTPVMVVLDGSGSMTTSDAPGPRITAAKQAVTGLVGALPSDAQVGLEVYGTSTGSSNAEKAAGCRDIKVLVPVGPIDPSSFDSKVAGIKASGYTPIGESLRTAAANLPKQGPRSIVLVSDGEDTCAPPQPCEVAKELKKQGVDLTVHTVGFKVNAAARGQLQCIATVTGGTYRDASDGSSLSSQLDEQVRRALRPYQPQGTPISGGATSGDAPELRPGQYVDTYDRGSTPGGTGTEKFYLVRLHAGDTPYISATVIPPAKPTPGTTLQVLVTVRPLDSNAACTVTGDGYDIGAGNKVAASTAVVTPGQIGGKSCLAAGPAIVQVTRSGDAFRDEALKMELAFRIEPPADASGLPGPAAAQSNLRADVTGPATALGSGTSFNDAPLVQPGVYHDSFVSGETRYAKVHLAWGQRLAYSISATKLPDLKIPDGVDGFTSLANPVREQMSQAAGNSSSTAFLGSTDTNLYGSTLVPVRYTNRDSTDADISHYSIDGDYYLILSTAFPTAGTGTFSAPYTLKISVTGTKERGPVYRPPSTGGQSATHSSAATSVSSPQISAAAGSAPSSGGVSAPVVVGGTAAGVLACAGGAAVFLRRRRLSGSHTQTLPSNDPWS